MGSTVWSPLCGGILTGKYNDGNIPEGARWDVNKKNPFLKSIWWNYFSGDKKEKVIKILKEL